MDTEFFYTRLAVERAKARFQKTLEEYWRLDTHLRALEDTNFRVCLFGSARLTAADPLYQTVFNLSRELAERGMDVITGGGAHDDVARPRAQCVAHEPNHLGEEDIADRETELVPDDLRDLVLEPFALLVGERQVVRISANVQLRAVEYLPGRLRMDRRQSADRDGQSHKQSASGEHGQD